MAGERNITEWDRRVLIVGEFEETQMVSETGSSWTSSVGCRSTFLFGTEMVLYEELE